MNSAVNNPVVGDERPFLAVTKQSQPVQNRLEVWRDDLVTLRIYVDNNASPDALGALESIAQNVRVHVLLPAAAQTWFNLVAFISVDNSVIPTINDTALLVGSEQLRLLYVAGSAHFAHLVNDEQVSEPLSDAIVSSQGLGLGNMRPGPLNGGFVTLEVRVAIG